MPRNKGNKAAALRVRLVPLVVIAEAPGIGYGNADCRIHFWCTRGRSKVDFVLYRADGFHAIQVNNGRSLRPADFRGIETFHRDSTTTLDGVLLELPSTLIGERVVLRYDPILPRSNRRLFVHHGGRHIGEARLVDSYANARVRRADLRLDPAGDDDNDAAGATAPRPGMANSAHVHPVLLIDEAHLLSTEILSEIRFHQFPRRFLQRADRHPLRFGKSHPQVRPARARGARQFHLRRHPLLRSPTCYFFQYLSRPLYLDVPQLNILHVRTPVDSGLESRIRTRWGTAPFHGAR